MSQQSFRDESNFKHEPHTKHHVDDSFGKNTDTRNWKKDVDKGKKPEEQQSNKSSGDKEK